MNSPAPKLVTPTEGTVLHAFGEEVRLCLSGEDTGGKLASWIETTPPGGGPPPHYHDNEDELFHVLEGQAEFFVGGEWKSAQAGTVAFAPKGSVHTFRNSGSEPLRMHIQTMPSGFEVFFARCADEFAKPGAPDMEKVIAIAEEHGIHFVGD